MAASIRTAKDLLPLAQPRFVFMVRSNFIQTPRLGRRKWLQAAGCATFTAGWMRNPLSPLEASAAAIATSSGTTDGYIDAHSHIWTRDIDRYPLSGGAGLNDLDPPSFTMDQLLTLMGRHGVRRVVLIQHHKFYGFDNRYMTDATGLNPERFRVVGMVNDLEPNPDTTMRSLLGQGVTGFRITSWIRGRKWLNGPGMEAVWRCAAETRQAICCLMDPPFLPSLDAMCRKHPDTPVVIDHFARIGVDGAIRSRDVKLLCRLARHRNTHVKLSAYYALGKKQPPYLDLIPMIRQLLDAYGPERLMWASDSPYQLQDGNSYADSLSLVRDRLDFLSEGDRDWLLRRTAQHIYWF